MTKFYSSIAILILALIGLISIQFYLLNESYAVQERTFRQNVRHSFNMIAKDLERMEFLQFSKRYIKIREKMHDRMIVPDDKNSTLIVLEDSIKIHSHQNSNDFTFFYQTERENKEKKRIESESFMQKKQFANVFNERSESTNLSNKQFEEEIEVDEIIAGKMLVERFRPNRSFYKELKNEFIDSLLNHHFTKAGITLPYRFNWTNRNPKNIMIPSRYHLPSFDYKHNGNSDLFVFNPFPEMLRKNSIQVEFYNVQSFLIKKIVVTAMLSTLFISLIIYVFIKTLKSLVKQKKLSELKTDFINNMTHEFKTPIASIAIAAEGLAKPKKTMDSDKISGFAKIIQEENQRLSNHVDRILQMAVYDKESIQLELENINLHDIIETVVGQFQLQCNEKHAEIKYELLAQNPFINGDTHHLLNMFTNFIDNALKYTANNPIIVIKTYNEDDFLIVSISDNGIGIAKDNLSMIFEKFYRESTGNKHNIKGFGLGLAYVKRICELHNATISVESKLNEGTVFTIRFTRNENMILVNKW